MASGLETCVLGDVLSANQSMNWMAFLLWGVEMLREFYTDGGCSPNPGLGAWAYVEKLSCGGVGYSCSGHERNTTNNRMEYTAAIKVLEKVLEESGRSKVRIYTDSELLVMTCSVWMYSWKRKGWVRGRGEIKNLDLVKRLYELCSMHTVKFVHVRGHSGVRFNELADELCTIEMRRNR